MAKKKVGNEQVVVKNVGKTRAVVYGKYMYPDETRKMSRKQAEALVKVHGKKNFKILTAKKGVQAAPTGSGKNTDKQKGKKKVQPELSKVPDSNTPEDDDSEPVVVTPEE